MIGSRRASSIFLCLVIATSGYAAAAKYKTKQDPQAVAVAQAAFTAMGCDQAVKAYQDSISTGTVTLYAGDNPVSYPITTKSKGLRETRIEIQMSKGTNIRIANEGQAATVRPDGTIRGLDSNNTFYEQVNHIPLLSVLSEFASGKVNLLYQGVQQLQGQSEDVVEVDFIPNDDQEAGKKLATMSRTLFYVNQSTRLVDKIQSTPLYEGNDENTFTEEVYLADYRSANGMLVPFHQTVLVDSKLDTDLTFTSITFNVGISDADFTFRRRGETCHGNWAVEWGY